MFSTSLITPVLRARSPGVVADSEGDAFTWRQIRSNKEKYMAISAQDKPIRFIQRCAKHFAKFYCIYFYHENTLSIPKKLKKMTHRIRKSENEEIKCCFTALFLNTIRPTRRLWKQLPNTFISDINTPNWMYHGPRTFHRTRTSHRNSQHLDEPWFETGVDKNVVTVELKTVLVINHDSLCHQG
jgi:hypothetical protein